MESESCSLCTLPYNYVCTRCAKPFCRYHSRFGAPQSSQTLPQERGWYCIGCWRELRDALKDRVVDKGALLEGFRQLDVSKGQRLIFQTSISSFGEVRGGANTIIEALTETVGSEGTLLVPAFTPGEEWRGANSTPVPQIIGAMAEVFRHWPGTRRSDHYRASWSAWGADADILINDSIPTEGRDINSPIGRLYQLGGKVLLLGVEFSSCTAIHLAENLAGAPFGCSPLFLRIEDRAAKLPSFRETIIGWARCRFMDMRELVSAAVEFLKEEKFGFLCSNPRCWYCPPVWREIEARKRI